jgi:hypothetical protein
MSLGMGPQRLHGGGACHTGEVRAKAAIAGRIGARRWAEDRYDRLPALAADLVRRRVVVIVSFASTPATVAAKAATALRRPPVAR